MSAWLDRVLAGFGGAAALAAFNYYQDGDYLAGTFGVGLVLVAVWLCAPTLAVRAPLGYILTHEQRQAFIDELSAVYGVTNRDEYPVWNPMTSWDPFGTPITWCRKFPDHDAHLWDVNGPSYAPVLCMGHDCLTPHEHMPNPLAKEGERA